MKKIKCFIEARMGSKRLPGKSMKILYDNIKLIDYVILNALNSRYIEIKNTYLLTSKENNNKKLIKYVKNKYKINVIAGSEENVFSRYIKFEKFDNFPIIRLTADNPLVDPKLIDEAIKYFKKSKSDYLTTRAMCHSKVWKVKSDYPKGISLEIFNSKKLFEKKNFFNLTNFNSPTWFFFNKKIKARIRKFSSFSFYKRFRGKSEFTIDTHKDYLKVKKIIKKNNFLPGKNNFYHMCKNNLGL